MCWIHCNRGPCKRDKAQAKNLEAKQYTLWEMNYTFSMGCRLIPGLSYVQPGLYCGHNLLSPSD